MLNKYPFFFFIIYFFFCNTILSCLASRLWDLPVKWIPELIGLKLGKTNTALVFFHQVLSYVQQPCRPLCKWLFLCAFEYGFYFLFCVYLPGARNFRGILTCWVYLKRAVSSCMASYGRLLLMCVSAVVLLAHHLACDQPCFKRATSSCASGTDWAPGPFPHLVCCSAFTCRSGERRLSATFSKK